MTNDFTVERLIEEVSMRPAIYARPSDPHAAKGKWDKLELWRDVGSSIYTDWDTIDQAEIYNRVLLLQRKWRSLRDAYSRELRMRKSAKIRPRRKVYMYYQQLNRFLKGNDDRHDGSEGPEDAEADEDGEREEDVGQEDEDSINFKQNFEITGDPLQPPQKRIKQSKSTEQEQEEWVIPIENEVDADADKLFLLSFVPDLKRLPPHIRMWARAQISNVMEEAVSCQYENRRPRERVAWR